MVLFKIFEKKIRKTIIEFQKKKFCQIPRNKLRLKREMKEIQVFHDMNLKHYKNGQAELKARSIKEDIKI